MLSPKVKIISLPYFKDSAKLFAPLANRLWSVFLDSGAPNSQYGRFDILAANPVCTLVTKGSVTDINQNGTVKQFTEDPFSLLKQQLGEYHPGIKGLPFNGGAIGYFSYDLARRLERLPEVAGSSEKIPEMAIGIYQWAVIVDHQLKRSCLVGQEHSEIDWSELQEQFSSIQKITKTENFKVLANVASNMTRESYAKAFSKVKYYLREGDCYQVNLSQRFSVECSGDPWQAYLKLRELNAAPFASYLNIPGAQVLSSSPERFLQVTGNFVETRPIKGTRPRRKDLIENQFQIEQLRQSEKDRAENVMIVDLLRNDLSKTCKIGSVKVPRLFSVESYATVHHLVSTITGTLQKGKHSLDLLRSCFPGGSITGAPKIRAMEIIEELEPDRRGVYCGSIGYIGFDGNMDTNIAIRTMTYHQNKIYFSAGGGIVQDSILEEEYQESFDKAAALIEVINQMKG